MTISRSKLKPKKCRACGYKFVPWTSTQVVCSPNCALDLEKIKKAKAYDKKTRELKQKYKSKADYKKDAQISFNKYIRLRDNQDPCISCGRDHGGQYHAGHYLSIGSHPELRFNTWNCHRQCAPCNNHLSGNQIRYRRRLIKKIGIDRVEWLEGKHEAKKYSVEDLKRIKAIFDKKYRLLIAKLDNS